MPRPVGVLGIAVRLKTRDGSSGSTASSPSRSVARAPRWSGRNGLGSVLLGGSDADPGASHQAQRRRSAISSSTRRGHDVVARGGRQLAGAALRALRSTASRTSGRCSRSPGSCGYRRVVLAGHSTGAQQRCSHYASWPRDRHVVGDHPARASLPTWRPRPSGSAGVSFAAACGHRGKNRPARSVEPGAAGVGLLERPPPHQPVSAPA